MGKHRRLPVLALLVALSAVSCSSNSAARSAKPLVPPGKAQVALLPDHGGLQYCANVRASDLAPPAARNVYVHSISVFLTSSDPTEPALLAVKGRYPGWDTPDTTIYQQPFTDGRTNSVWVEIIHEFPLGMMCVEVYGSLLRPSHYKTFNDRMLVAYTYLPAKGPGISTQKLFPISWGPYLHRYSPHRRPKH